MSTELPSLSDLFAEHFYEALADCLQMRNPGGPASASAVERQAQNLIAAWRKACTITTLEQLEALPPETVIKTEGGSIACRFYDREHGVVFGDDRPFKWPRLESELPGIVLWHPDWNIAK